MFISIAKVIECSMNLKSIYNICARIFVGVYRLDNSVKTLAVGCLERYV